MADPEPHGHPRPEIGDLSPDDRHYWDGDIWGWQPLWLVPDEVVDAARQRFDHTPTATAAQFLASGLLNQSWRVDTSQGSYVLRVSRSERTHEQVAYEHAFARELNKHISAVVPPLPGRDGATIQPWRGLLLSLFPFIEGIPGVAIPPADRNRQAASVLARIHRVSLDLLQFDQRPDFRSVDEHPRWIWSAVKPTLSKELANTGGFADLAAALNDEIASLDAWLDGLHASQRPLPRATVHGDFNPRNLIFQDRRLAAVIDWDECRVEPLAWEVAQVAYGEGEGDPIAFWDSYLAAGGPLAPEDVDLLPGFARMGALSELQWTVNDGQVTPHAFTQVRDVVASLTGLPAIGSIVRGRKWG